MDSLYEEMITFVISKIKNKDIRKGLKIALEIIKVQGYYDLKDWENMTEDEKMEEIKSYMSSIM